MNKEEYIEIGENIVDAFKDNITITYQINADTLKGRETFIYSTYELMLDHCIRLMNKPVDMSFYCEKIITERLYDGFAMGGTSKHEIIHKEQLLKDIKIKQREYKIKRILKK
jgi:hypothetical protein